MSLKTLNYDQCVRVFTGQIEQIKKISAAQNEVRQAVLKREWVDFEEKTAEINRLSEEFALLEQERAEIFSSFKEERSFYIAVIDFPDEQRDQLMRLYRELKMEVLKLKALNETFLVYLAEAKNMAVTYLEAVCPARGGKLYTRKGRKASHDFRSIVVNNRF